MVEPSTASSSVTANPTSVTVSDGSEISTVTLQLKDSSGTNITIDGWTVTWAASIPGGSVTLGTFVDNQDGTYTVTAASSKAGRQPSPPTSRVHQWRTRLSWTSLLIRFRRV